MSQTIIDLIKSIAVQSISPIGVRDTGHGWLSPIGRSSNRTHRIATFSLNAIIIIIEFFFWRDSVSDFFRAVVQIFFGDP